jgi:uncharacterized Zn finger protein
MTPWGSDRFPQYSRKRPAPARGIKASKLGTTWWGQRWIEALERVLQGDSGRLARGRTYARAGRTHDFVIESGKVKAKVTGSRAPYQIRIELLQLSDATWQAAIAFMAQRAEFSALLLNGEMPREIDDAFEAARASLFPKTRADLQTSCDCPDDGDPCKHIAAVHYVLGEALDRDPFLLFELRGRSREQFLHALRAARGSSPEGHDADVSSFEKTPSVTLETLTAKSYDAAPAPLPLLSFTFDPPRAPAAVLRQLGAPGSWNRDRPPLETLAPIVQTAAATARRLALSESEPSSPTPATSPPEMPAPRRKKS